MGKLGGILLIVVLVGLIVYLSSTGNLFPALDFNGTAGNASDTEDVFIGPPDTEDQPLSPGEEKEKAVNPRDIPEGFTENQLSPYFHKVRIASVSASGFNRVSGIKLRGEYSLKESVDVTGWMLKGNKGFYVIERAANMYHPLSQPTLGDIYLKSGDYLGIYSTSSPLGVNIRLNKCVGYLANHYSFDPSLYSSCPTLERPALSTLTGKCQDYIISISGCREPDSNPPIDSDDTVCRAFLNDINYRGCLDRHRADGDFLEDEWRVWTGSRISFLDERHDRVLLLDRAGLLADLYTY